MRERLQPCAIGVVGLIAWLLLSIATEGAERSTPSRRLT